MSTITTEDFTKVTEKHRLIDARSDKSKDASEAISELEGLRTQKLIDRIEAVQKTLSIAGQGLVGLASNKHTQRALKPIAPVAQFVMGAGMTVLSGLFKAHAHGLKVGSAETKRDNAMAFLNDPNNALKMDG